jgi:hypothetical protein
MFGKIWNFGWERDCWFVLITGESLKVLVPQSVYSGLFELFYNHLPVAPTSIQIKCDTRSVKPPAYRVLSQSSQRLE